MSAVISSLARAIGQIGDRAILRVLAKSIAITLAIFVALGVALGFGLGRMFGSYGIEGGGWAGTLAAIILTGLAFWFLFRVVAIAVLQFFADEVVAAVEARNYPDLASGAKKLPFRRDLANSLRGAARALGYNFLALPVAAILLFTAIGPALVFLAVNAVLLGRELTDMALLRHEHLLPRAAVPRRERWALGAVVAAMMLIPFANLLAPVIGAAAGTHLALGKARRPERLDA